MLILVTKMSSSMMQSTDNNSEANTDFFQAAKEGQSFFAFRIG